MSWGRGKVKVSHVTKLHLFGGYMQFFLFISSENKLAKFFTHDNNLIHFVCRVVWMEKKQGLWLVTPAAVLIRYMETSVLHKRVLAFYLLTEPFKGLHINAQSWSHFTWIIRGVKIHFGALQHVQVETAFSLCFQLLRWVVRHVKKKANSYMSITLLMIWNRSLVYSTHTILHNSWHLLDYFYVMEQFQGYGKT